MKSIPLLLAIILFVTIPVVWVISALMPPPLPEALVITPEQHELGSLKPVITKCQFAIKNGYPCDIDILAVQKSCGCTTTTLSKSHLHHGESAALEATVSLRGRRGNFLSHMSILYRRVDPKQPELLTTVCTVHAVVDPAIRVSVDALSFHQIARASKTIDIDVTDGVSRVTAVSSTHKAFSAKLSDDAKHIIVDFFPGAWGSHDGVPFISITTTCPEEDRILVPIYVGDSSTDELTKSLSAGNGF